VQSGDLAQALGHRSHALIRERESVEHCRFEPFGAPGVQVLPVGFQQLGGITLQSARHRVQGIVLRPASGTRQDARSRSRCAADTMHV